MQIFKAALILPVCFLLSHYSFCQNFKQNIKGKIINSVNEQAVEGANITLLNTSPQLGTSSDKNGNFVIENVPVGRYTILVQHVAFSNKQLSNILVISAKENYLIIPLSPQSQLIKAVDISDNIEPIQTINTLIFSAEEVNRYAATF
ncbi:MAG: carboxypeptidase-like regulatory domain-containing protein, partial [Bacteroidia bacterium]|nr:carboxypeptidase-like regulatory domain-containing protein [Bacteroidia bacterium]